MTTKKLNGRVAVITGAARGLGQAFARRLAEDGADIAAADLLTAGETESLVVAAGQRFFASVTDVTDASAVSEFAAAVLKHFGRVDILINNAGIYPFQSFEEMRFEDWRRVLRTDLDALFLTTKAFLPALKKSGQGRVINVTSNTVWTVTPNFVHYISAKAGVIGFTRAVATELADSKITVNCVGPSLTRTPGTEENGAVEYLEQYAQMQAIHRSETPQDLIGAVSFLASDDAAFMTGQTLLVDGGLVRL